MYFYIYIYISLSLSLSLSLSPSPPQGVQEKLKASGNIHIVIYIFTKNLCARDSSSNIPIPSYPRIILSSPPPHSLGFSFETFESIHFPSFQVALHLRGFSPRDASSSSMGNSHSSRRRFDALELRLDGVQVRDLLRPSWSPSKGSKGRAPRWKPAEIAGQGYHIIYIYIHLCMYVCMYVCMYIYICVYIYIY